MHLLLWLLRGHLAGAAGSISFLSQWRSEAEAEMTGQIGAIPRDSVTLAATEALLR